MRFVPLRFSEGDTHGQLEDVPWGQRMGEALGLDVELQFEGLSWLIHVYPIKQNDANIHAIPETHACFFVWLVLIIFVLKMNGMV